MSFTAAVAAMDAIVQTDLGQPVTYTPAASGTPATIQAVEVFLSEREALQNAFANVFDVSRRWSFLKTAVTQPVRGDSITVGGATFKVDYIDENGSDYYRWVVVVV